MVLLVLLEVLEMHGEYIRLNLHYSFVAHFAVCYNWQRKKEVCLVIFRRLLFGCQVMFSSISHHA